MHLEPLPCESCSSLKVGLQLRSLGRFPVTLDPAPPLASHLALRLRRTIEHRMPRCLVP